MLSFIEQFVSPAQAYLKVTASDQPSAANQNLAKMMIPNANLTEKTLTYAMPSFVAFAKDKDRTATFSQITANSLPALTSVLKKDIAGDVDEKPKHTALESMTLLINVRRQQLGFNCGCSYGEYISLSDAISSLEKTGMTENELGSSTADMQPRTNAFGAHMSLAKNFFRTGAVCESETRTENRYWKTYASNPDFW